MQGLLGMAEGTGTGTETTGTATGTVPPAEAPAVTPEVTPAVSTATTTPITAEQLAAVKPVLQQQMAVDKAEASNAAAKLDEAADSGNLTLDVDAADALIKAVDAARDQVMDLWKRTTDQLATPLQLGRTRSPRRSARGSPTSPSVRTPAPRRRCWTSSRCSTTSATP